MVADVVAKTMDGRLEDFVKEAVALVARELMEAEISDEIAAGLSEVAPESRSTHRNGYRPRAWETRVGEIELLIPKKRSGSSYFPSSLEVVAQRGKCEDLPVVAGCRADPARGWMQESLSSRSLPYRRRDASQSPVGENERVDADPLKWRQMPMRVSSASPSADHTERCGAGGRFGCDQAYSQSADCCSSGSPEGAISSRSMVSSVSPRSSRVAIDARSSRSRYGCLAAWHLDGDAGTPTIPAVGSGSICVRLPARGGSC